MLLLRPLLIVIKYRLTISGRTNNFHQSHLSKALGVKYKTVSAHPLLIYIKFTDLIIVEIIVADQTNAELL